MDSARHVIGCDVTKSTRIQNAFDDVASATSWDVMLLTQVGFIRLMTWRTLPIRPDHKREARLHDSARQGFGA
jgi:hypothetical protein